ncbi:hypothetical protein ACHMXB_05655 [Arthrobacter sp. UC242_113]|uniref:hypothetical protein n=1 Tax=Arthrobacter sp. UC242_113 TaxID=3374550 RepID=UPI00375659AB
MSLTSEVEILRGDLAELLVSASSASTEYRFGNWITSVQQEDDAALVTFEQGGAERFALVVAADRISSDTRRLVFDDAPVVKSLGVEATWATIARTGWDTDWWRWFNTRGGTISLRPDRHGTMRVLVTRTLTRGEKRDVRRRTPYEQRALLRQALSAPAGRQPCATDCPVMSGSCGRGSTRPRNCLPGCRGSRTPRPGPASPCFRLPCA